jgi:hypothetical protein
MGIYRDKPARQPDGNPNDGADGRNDQYGDRYVVPVGGGSNWALADEGSYFVATNATLATGLAGHAAPVVADTDTKPFLHVYNAGQSVICPDFAVFELTAIGAGGTINYLTSYVDAKGATAYSSGGTQLTPVCTKTSVGNNTGATIFAGAVVAAMSNSRKVAQQVVREVIPVVQDTITVIWGSPNGAARAALTTAGTATNHSVLYLPAVAIAPGGNLNVSFIRPSQSGANSYQVQFGYWER